LARETIDYGIDLGTTNSEVAVLRGTEIEVLRNNEGLEYTPSAVWIDPKNRLWVGTRAKERLDSDPDNAFCEFKLQMGTTEDKVFAGSGKRAKPEELSAEILKALKATVMQRTGEDLQAAVITVPAAFELPQCDATKRAAQMAGLRQTPLLQEPSAAALAYGFDSSSDKVFWLVYDFGGGTFDAAVIQVRDGMINVVNHGGDNHLGGKLIDWAIVDELLIPAVTREHKLYDFNRGNPRWRGAIAKLKLEAEKAKIRVSGGETAEIIVDRLFDDDDGRPMSFEYELQQGDVERLAEPLILRSINICKKVLSDRRLGTSSVEKLILVGGPTLTPYLRERVSDKDEGLGIPLDFSVDPLTVVARGAAVFAGAQRSERRNDGPPPPGTLRLELDYQPMGPETEPLVGGKVLDTEPREFSGFTIEFTNADSQPPWRSGKLGLGPEGTFVTNLWAEKGRRNTFKIELCDPAGQRVETEPDGLSYTVAVVQSHQTLIHSVGVATVSDEMRPFFEKGTPLPARRRELFRTAFELHQGKAEDVMLIPVMEGENSRATRNHRIGRLEIEARTVRRNVPAGSDVEVTIEIDESRLIRVKGYIPVVDEEYEKVLTLGYEKADPKQVKEDLDREKERLDKIRKQADETGDETAQDVLDRVDRERMVHEVEGSLAAASADPDARQKAQNRLGDLRVALDEAEDAVEWPVLVKEAEESVSQSKAIAREHGNSGDTRALERLEAEVRRAIETHDADILRKRVDEMWQFGLRIIDREGILQVLIFRDLCEKKGQMSDQVMADQLVAEGQRAMSRNDDGSLRSVNQQLRALLPGPLQETKKSWVF
jgi:molecular chaperone DnaK